MLYIIRHGKTDWNARKKIQGWTDIPLNEEGREGAQAAREEYKDVHFDVCYVSPLIRARETAEILLEGRDIPIIVDERLKEMGFGDYEGVENSFQIPDCPINPLFQNPTEYVTVPGGESFDDLFNRTGEFLKEVALPLVEEGKDVLIVGHGAMNCGLITQYRGVSLEHFWDEMTGNCELKELTAGGHLDSVWKW